MKISVLSVKWKDNKAEGVVAKAAVLFEDVGLELHDVPIFSGFSRPWAALPKRQQISGKGKVVRSAHDVETMAFRNILDAAKFSEAVIAEVERKHPAEFARMRERTGEQQRHVGSDRHQQSVPRG